MYSGSDKYAQNAQKLYSGVKRATVAITALFTLVSTPAVIATENATSLNSLTESSVPSFQLKYREAPADIAIEGQYIVVFKNDVVMQEAASLAGGMSVMNDEMMAMDFRAQTVYSMAENLAANFDAQIEHNFYASIAGFSAKMSHKSMLKMLNNDNIEFIEQDRMVSINATQNGATWGLDRIDQENRPLDGSYTYNYDGSGVTAYIVDTGIASHSEFEGRVRSGYTAINDGNGTEDCQGHGTHVAGTVGSEEWGVAKEVTLVPVRVLSCSGSGSNSGVIAGVDYVRQNASGPAVANMSLGGGASSALDRAIANAVDSGVVFVVAAGNETQNACNVSPAREPKAITVGSSTSSDARSSFSNYGSCVDIFAPGSSITSTWLNGRSNTISGTSMASPHVAGVVALYLDQYPNASPAQVDQALKDNAAVGKISGVNGSPNLLLQSIFDGTGPTPTPTPTFTPTPTPTTTPTPGGELFNGVPVSGLSGSTGDYLNFTFDVPAGASDIVITTSGSNGDADLYVSFEERPTEDNADCSSTSPQSNETCSMGETGGTYYILVHAWSSFSGLTVEASYEGVSPTPTPTPTPTPSPTPGPGPEPIDITVPDNTVGWFVPWLRYTLDLEEGYTVLKVTTSGGSGDPDLYLNFGSESSLSNFDCKSANSGTSEECIIEAPEAGTWHIDIYSYRWSGFRNVDLRVVAE